MSTLATPANMRRFEEAHPSRDHPDGGRIEPVRAIAWSPITGEEYSASSGDYFTQRDDVALFDEAGEPMLLVVRAGGYRDAFDEGEIHHAA